MRKLTKLVAMISIIVCASIFILYLNKIPLQSVMAELGIPVNQQDAPSHINTNNHILQDNGDDKLSDLVQTVQNLKGKLSDGLNQVSNSKFVSNVRTTVSKKLSTIIQKQGNSSAYQTLEPVASKKETTALNAKVKKIRKKIITKDMSDVEKVKAVHDYIVQNTVYDSDNVKKNTIPDYDFQAEGVLFHGKAVCQGYAYAFQLFMKQLNIPSKLVTGIDLKTGVGHAWNMVSLGGKWYHVDTTWDDPVPDQKGKVQYHYFLITDKILSADHSWDKNKFPSCSSEKYLYYVYQNDIIESVDQYREAFMNKYNAGERTITLLYPEKKIPDMKFLLNDEKIRKEKDGKYTVSYQTIDPWRLGDYTVFTVIME